MSRYLSLALVWRYAAGRWLSGALVWEYAAGRCLWVALVGYSNKNHQPSGALVGKHFGNSFLRLRPIECLNRGVIAQLRPIEGFNKHVIAKLHPIEYLNEGVIAQLRPIEGLNGSESAPGVHEIE